MSRHGALFMVLKPFSARLELPTSNVRRRTNHNVRTLPGTRVVTLENQPFPIPIWDAIKSQNDRIT